MLEIWTEMRSDERQPDWHQREFVREPHRRPASLEVPVGPWLTCTHTLFKNSESPSRDLRVDVMLGRLTHSRHAMLFKPKANPPEG